MKSSLNAPKEQFAWHETRCLFSVDVEAANHAFLTSNKKVRMLTLVVAEMLLQTATWGLRRGHWTIDKHNVQPVKSDYLHIDSLASERWEHLWSISFTFEQSAWAKKLTQWIIIMLCYFSLMINIIHGVINNSINQIYISNMFIIHHGLLLHSFY